jgi:hypothetical protein
MPCQAHQTLLISVDFHARNKRFGLTSLWPVCSSAHTEQARERGDVARRTRTEHLLMTRMLAPDAVDDGGPPSSQGSGVMLRLRRSKGTGSCPLLLLQR